MNKVSFLLKKPDPKTGLSLIYLQVKYAGQRLVFTFNEKVNHKAWSEKRQRVKGTSQTTEDGKFLLNDFLNDLEANLIRIYREELKNGVPSAELLKDRLKAHLYRNINASETRPKINLMDLIDRFVGNEVGDPKGYNTLKGYKTAREHLKAYMSKYRVYLDFEDITIPFRDKYIRFLESSGLKRNSIAKDLNILQVFMNYAFDEGYTTNQNHRKRRFRMTEEETEAVYLTEKEILKINKLILKDRPAYDRVRDLFVFGCFVGLRYSDYSNRVKRENIVDREGEKFIELIMQKTARKVVIPVHPIVLSILEKYQWNLPKAPANQPFNRMVKEVCKLAGLDAKGRLSKEPETELYDAVSSHTARRSFATNYYLQGFPIYHLMNITGHKTEKSFLRYIKADKLESAKMLGIHVRQKWEEKLMRVV